MSSDQFRPKYPPRYPGAPATDAEIRGDDLAKRKAVADIAKTLNFETLEPQGSDSLDFRDVYVLSLRAALEAAYDAGKREAPESPAEWIMRQPDGTQTKVTVEKIVAKAVVNMPEQKVRTWPLDPYLPDTAE